MDIPYWMGFFKDWEAAWPSFDDYTVEAFGRKTGLDARKDVKLGNFGDPGFRKWTDFRIQTITDFLREIDVNVKKVNPKCKTIAEIYPGFRGRQAFVDADLLLRGRAEDQACRRDEESVHGGRQRLGRQRARDVGIQ